MSKQDRQGVRTATDLERKYKLSNLVAQASENARQDSQINQLNFTASDLENRVNALEQSDEETYGFLVTVQTDSLDAESLTADKSFAEIEEAVLAGQHVRIKLVCASEDSHLYLRMTSHLAGSEANFCGYYNGVPIELQLLAE